MILPYSPACERNKEVILETITPYLGSAKTVLEIGSGTAQHAIHFAQSFVDLSWQTSDCQQYLDGINAQIANVKQCATTPLSNLLEPIKLDVNQAVWIAQSRQFDVIYSANTLHIMDDASVKAFFAGLLQVSNANAVLVIYGPFKYNGRFTSESNQQFDDILRAREIGSCIKDFEAVNRLANSASFRLVEDRAMPANNQCLIYKRELVAG